MNKEFIGLSLEKDHIRIAHVKKERGMLKLLELDRYELAESIINASDEAEQGERIGSRKKTVNADAAGDDVFGFKSPKKKKTDKDEIDFEQLEANVKRKEAELQTLDMVNEASNGETASNTVLLYNILMDTNPKAVNLGLNIPAGETIFKVMRDGDYNDIKTKDLVENLEEKLTSIYGEPRSSDHYAYEVREDGSLVLATVGDEAALLQLTNETREIYGGKVRVKSIYPDEVALVGLLKANHHLPADEITALIQFGPGSCHVVFLEGEEILQVMRLVNEGSENANILSKVYSKLLFQLDTEDISNLNRIILANNPFGEESVEYLSKYFRDVSVHEFNYDEELFDIGRYNEEAIQPFTSAIAMAWAASGLNAKSMPALELMPSYVQERQKIFKLQWHGLLLLVLIFLSIPSINYYYQTNSSKIASQTRELEITKANIKQVKPIVDRTNNISRNLALLTSKLALLDSLSAGSKTWSTKLDIINRGMNRIPNSWFVSLANSNGNSFIKGYAVYRNRIPAIVNIFSDATLMNVTIDKLREKQILEFSMMAKKFVKDSTVYSPEKSQKISQLLNN